jgi:hypothetical protein
MNIDDRRVWLWYDERRAIAVAQTEVEMQRQHIVKGRLVGPKSVELDEPVVGMTAEVEVLVRPASDASGQAGETVSDFLRRIPAGTRSKEEIDRQVHAERESWGVC